MLGTFLKKKCFGFFIVWGAFVSVCSSHVGKTDKRQDHESWQHHISDLHCSSLSVNFTSWLPAAQKRCVILPCFVKVLMEPFKSETAAQWKHKACGWCHFTAVCSIMAYNGSIHVPSDENFSNSECMGFHCGARCQVTLHECCFKRFGLTHHIVRS